MIADGSRTNPVKRGNAANARDVTAELSSHDARDGQCQRRRAMEDDRRQAGRARDGGIGVNGIPDACALGVHVRDACRELHVLAPEDVTGAHDRAGERIGDASRLRRVDAAEDQAVVRRREHAPVGVDGRQPRDDERAGPPALDRHQ